MMCSRWALASAGFSPIFSRCFELFLVGFLLVHRLYELNKHSIYLTTFCENIPQIVLQASKCFQSNKKRDKTVSLLQKVIYGAVSGQFFENSVLLNAFISSTLAVVASIIGACLRKDLSWNNFNIHIDFPFKGLPGADALKRAQRFKGLQTNKLC